MCLPMGSDFGQTVTGVVHFEKRTETHLKLKYLKVMTGQMDLNSPTIIPWSINLTNLTEIYFELQAQNK